MKTLKKSNNKIVAGVCAGIAEYFKIDPVIVRLIWVGLALLWFFFPAIILYIIAMFIMPSDESTYESTDSVEKLKSANVDEEPKNQKTESKKSTSAPHNDDDFNSFFNK